MSEVEVGGGRESEEELAGGREEVAWGREDDCREVGSESGEEVARGMEDV